MIPFDFPYPIHPECIPPGDDTAGRYTISFAKDPGELDEVLRLRYQVFNLELGEGLETSKVTQRDLDPFDPTFHHLLIRDNDTGQVVGTYRMQTLEMARMGRGFYSAGEFDLSALPKHIQDQSVEIGRACIASDHRNGRVLFLLWRGLMRYLKFNEKRYLFGCCSITSQDPEEGLVVFDHLRKNNWLRDDFVIKAQPGYTCEVAPQTLHMFPTPKIPRLMRIYLSYHAKMCSEPAIDREFKTIDFLALIDIQDFDEKMARNIGE